MIDFEPIEIFNKNTLVLIFIEGKIDGRGCFTTNFDFPIDVLRSRVALQCCYSRFCEF